MKLYFAGAGGDLKNLHKSGAKHILISMAGGLTQIKQSAEYKGFNLMIDSGAFSYQKGDGISLAQWIEEAQSIRKFGSELIGLDVIGNAKQTGLYYNEIRKHFDCIPTFHVGSDLKYFGKYMDQTDRIAIGGMVTMGVNSRQLIIELDKIFKYMGKANFKKLHAFGVFSDGVLRRYPFYSADSSGWLNAMRFNVHRFFKNGKISRERTMSEIRLMDEEQRGKHITIHHLTDRRHKTMNHISESQKYEMYLTNLWKERGIEWDD